jgi:hypothetical protein
MAEPAAAANVIVRNGPRLLTSFNGINHRDRA